MMTIQRLAAAILTASLIAVGVPACGDDGDDEGASDGGDSGRGGSGDSGRGGSGGKGGAHGGAHAGKGGSGSSGSGGSGADGSGDDAGVAEEIDSKAADLRVALNLLLGEHLILAAKATGAALGGRSDEFTAYGDLLNENGSDLGAAIETAYGADAETAFNAIWSAHNGYFVDYTTGVATGDQAKQDKAVEDLTTKYVPDFVDLLNGATSIPKDALTPLVTDHVLQTKAIVDAQNDNDWTKAYAAIRTAFHHMATLSDPLAKAIAEGEADEFPGDPSTKAVDFRVALNRLLQEHLYLASFATGAALGGRTEEFAAAGASLNENGTTIGSALGGLYGDEAETQFNAIWSAHNGYFVDYTTGVATDDEAKRAKAVEDLTEKYVPDFADFLSGATDIPTDGLSTLITDHVLTTKAIVDAQGAENVDEKKVAEADRMAGMHMQMLGDPLSKAIVEKLPAKF